MSRRRLGVAAVLTIVAVSAVGVFVVDWVVPHLRSDTVEICGRDYRKGSTTWSHEQVVELGPIHKVGESRIGETLWTLQTAWDQGECDGLVATVLLSREASRWEVWTLRGGP